MANQDPFWWKQESERDKTLRLLIQKTGELGRLPTYEELRVDPRMPSTIAISSIEGTFAGAMAEVASLLFGHRDRKTPEDLIGEQHSLSSEQQTAARQQQRQRYEERLKLLSEPGELQKQRNRQFHEREVRLMRNRSLPHRSALSTSEPRYSPLMRLRTGSSHRRLKK